MSKLHFKMMELGPIATNAYLIWKENSEEAVLIDAPPDCSAEVNYELKKEGLRLSEIWLTHGHWDHMAGAKELAGNGVKVYGHQDDQLMFEQPEVMSAFAIPGLNLQPIEISNWVEQGDQLDFLGSKAEVRHCPGHCPGNVIFWFGDESLCFVGDVIFREGVGRYDLPGGDFNQLEQSILNNIFTLPGETKLLSGHGPITTVNHEIKSNPFVRPV